MTGNVQHGGGGVARGRVVRAASCRGSPRWRRCWSAASAGRGRSWPPDLRGVCPAGGARYIAQHPLEQIRVPEGHSPGMHLYGHVLPSAPTQLGFVGAGRRRAQICDSPRRSCPGRASWMSCNAHLVQFLGRATADGWWPAVGLHDPALPIRYEERVDAVLEQFTIALVGRSAAGHTGRHSIPLRRPGRRWPGPAANSSSPRAFGAGWTRVITPTRWSCASSGTQIADLPVAPALSSSGRCSQRSSVRVSAPGRPRRLRTTQPASPRSTVSRNSRRVALAGLLAVHYGRIRPRLRPSSSTMIVPRSPPTFLRVAKKSRVSTDTQVECGGNLTADVYRAGQRWNAGRVGRVMRLDYSTVDLAMPLWGPSCV